jgi:hypothetical protein
LSAEGQNRINIYGQNANGWTAYNSWIFYMCKLLTDSLHMLNIMI